MEYSRRDFLRRTGCTAASVAAITAGLDRLGMVNVLAAPSDYRALVCVFLNGGNDSHNMVVPLEATGPFAYSGYYAARSPFGLAIPSTGAPGTALVPIQVPAFGNATFGLHPSLGPAGVPSLHSLWGQGKLAVVANVGPLVEPLTQAQYKSSGKKPYQLFSHSDQVTQWQTSVSNTRGQTGWGGRIADRVVSLNGGNGFPVVTSIGGTQIFNLGAATRPLGMGTGALNQVLVLNGFNNNNTDAAARRNSMDYLRTLDKTFSLVDNSQDTTQQALDIGLALSTDPVLTTVFPNTGIGNQLRQVAKIMMLNQTSAALGLNRQIFFTSIGGFDTHTNQVGSQQTLLRQMSDAMAAFYNATVELAIANRVTTFTLSDFGRTLQPSGSGGGVGTDHGWGAHHFVMGGAVKGGNFYGAVAPGSNGTIFPTVALPSPVDTDNRGRWIPSVSVDQYGATLASWLGVAPADLATVFPNIGRFATNNLGFMV
jgi:uncharacterized protein (DUF1501 family)